MKTKCNKCDDRGYIQDTKYSSHSCKCGWAIEQSSLVFKGVSLENLLAYGAMRSIQKGKASN